MFGGLLTVIMEKEFLGCISKRHGKDSLGRNKEIKKVRSLKSERELHYEPELVV